MKEPCCRSAVIRTRFDWVYFNYPALQREQCCRSWWEWIPARVLASVSRTSRCDWYLPKHTLSPVFLRNGVGRTRQRCLSLFRVHRVPQCSSTAGKNAAQLPVMKMPLKCRGCFDLLENQKTSFQRLALLVYTLWESDCVIHADEGTMGGFRSASDVAVTSSSVLLAQGQQSALNNRSPTSV